MAIDDNPAHRAKGFPKGVSPNPGGLSKAAIKARRLAADYVRESTDGGKEIIEFAVNVMRGHEDGCDDNKSRRWAADFLANRLWGKAPLTVEVTGPSEAVPVPDVRGLSIEELRRMAAGEGAPADDDPAGNVH